jgi:hypothetical protein
MKTHASVLVGFAFLGLLAAAVPGVVAVTRAQQPPGNGLPTAGKGVEKMLARVRDSWWKQKAEIELEILKAQVVAKKAEIEKAEAEHRIRELEPTQAIFAKLERPIPMKFPDETPLEDLLKYVKSATVGPNDNGIPIYVDPVGLQEAHKTMTSPVTIDLEGVPLGTTLHFVLKQLGLIYEVKDGLLTITSEVDDKE